MSGETPIQQSPEGTTRARPAIFKNIIKKIIINNGGGNRRDSTGRFYSQRFYDAAAAAGIFHGGAIISYLIRFLRVFGLYAHYSQCLKFSVLPIVISRIRGFLYSSDVSVGIIIRIYIVVPPLLY